MDNLCCFDSALAVGYSYCLYDGGTDSYSSCDCDYYGAGTHHTRAPGYVVIGMKISKMAVKQ